MIHITNTFVLKKLPRTAPEYQGSLEACCSRTYDRSVLGSVSVAAKRGTQPTAERRTTSAHAVGSRRGKGLQVVFPFSGDILSLGPVDLCKRTTPVYIAPAIFTILVSGLAHTVHPAHLNTCWSGCLNNILGRHVSSVRDI